VTVDAVYQADNPRDDGLRWAATCTSNGKEYSVWIDHLQATNEADRLNHWEVAS
jgi:hypothetical protein